MDPKLQRLLTRLETVAPQHQDVSAVLLRQMNRIRIRTLAGRDVNGFPFLHKKDGSPSTLSKTGTLLRSLQIQSGEGERGLVGRITVTGRAREYAPYVNAKRRFMGASISDRLAMMSDLRDSIRERRGR